MGPRRGFVPTLAAAAGAAARGGKWLYNSALGKRARSAAAAYASKRFVKRKTESPNDAGAAAQYERYAFKLGRKRTLKEASDKLIARNMSNILWRYGAVNNFAAGEGPFRLARIGAQGSTQTLPIHILELTNFGPGSNPTNMSVSLPHRSFQINTNGTISPVTQVGRANDGLTGTSNYVPLTTNATEALSINVWPNAILEYSNIKLLFRCPKNVPGWFKVSLVQFTDEKVLPGVVSSTLTDPYHGFWQRRAKALIYNPIAHEAGPATSKGQSPGMRIIKTWVRRWNPDTSDNLATYSGSQIRLDLFIRHNRYCNFRSEVTGAHTSAVTLNDDAYVPDLDETYPNQVEAIVHNHPAQFRGRVFLLIEGTDFTNQKNDLFDPNWHLSFDMEVRNKWLYRQDP